MTDSSAVISVEALSVALPEGGDRPLAIREVSLRIDPGETLCLVGESGSGKTVVAQSIIGMLPRALPVTGGRVLFRGRKLPAQRDSAFDSIRSVELAMIFQDAVTSLDPVQRVGRQLDEILAVHGTPRRERRANVLEMLEAVRLPEPHRIYKAYPHQLSGGQAQRIVIAGALILNPRLLIADEPTTALDVSTQAEILALITALQKERGTSVLFITHDFGVVSRIADRVAVMKEGRIVEEGPATRLLRKARHPYTRSLLAAARRGGEGQLRGTEPPVLEVEGAELTYRPGNVFARRRIQAVRGVSLSLRPGNTLAIVGESGSGKSSLARCILGLEQIDKGTIRFRGNDMSRMGGAELRALRKKIQMVQQDPYSALNPRQRVRDAIAEGPIIHRTPRRDALARAEELLSITGLSAHASGRYPHEFSGGQLQRICIARALALEPEVLVADEAVSALDVSIQVQILDLFRDMQRRFGFAMIFITHDLRVARAISGEILVMKNGKAVEAGRASEVFRKPRHPYTRALLAAAPVVAGHTQ